MSDEGRRELLHLVATFLARHKSLSEHSQLARLEADILAGSEPREVIRFLSAHARHAARAAELQLSVGELAARMAALLEREFPPSA